MFRRERTVCGGWVWWWWFRPLVYWLRLVGCGGDADWCVQLLVLPCWLSNTTHNPSSSPFSPHLLSSLNSTVSGYQMPEWQSDGQENGEKEAQQRQETLSFFLSLVLDALEENRNKLNGDMEKRSPNLTALVCWCPLFLLLLLFNSSTIMGSKLPENPPVFPILHPTSLDLKINLSSVALNHKER